MKLTKTTTGDTHAYRIWVLGPFKTRENRSETISVIRPKVDVVCTQLAPNSKALFSSAASPKMRNSPFHFWFGSRARYRFSLHFFVFVLFFHFVQNSVQRQDENGRNRVAVNSIVRVVVVVVVDRTKTTIKT